MLSLCNVAVVQVIFRCYPVRVMFVASLKTHVMWPVRPGWGYDPGRSEVPFKLRGITDNVLVLTQWFMEQKYLHTYPPVFQNHRSNKEEQYDCECCHTEGNQDVIKNLVRTLFILWR